jgi:aminoglycoside phosphotransferase (APT) family kinase protein
VNELGFDSLAQQAVHGDWHPGNMLFSKHKIAVVLDFDSTKIALPIAGLANGARPPFPPRYASRDTSDGFKLRA